MSKQRMQSTVDAPEIMAFFGLVFRSDVRFRIIVELAKREGACQSEISRNVGMSRKNLVRYLELLVHRGIVEAYSVGIRDNVYRLSAKYNAIRPLLVKNGF